MPNHYIFFEYDYIKKSQSNTTIDRTKNLWKSENDCELAENYYEELEEFIVKHNLEESDKEKTTDKFKLYRQSIKCRSLIGCIKLKDDTIIEFLPKLCLTQKETDAKEQLKATRKKLAEMYSQYNNTLTKLVQEADYGTFDQPLVENGIELFLHLIEKLIRQGIKYEYKEEEENLNYYTGRLSIPNQIKYNLIHKERFYVIHDNYSPDHPMNRLIKSALRKILFTTINFENQRKARQLLSFFSDVQYSSNPHLDYQKKLVDRNYQAYDVAIDWSYAILNNRMYEFYNIGKYSDYSFLIPMDNLYENYVFENFRKECRRKKDNWIVHPQAERALFDRLERTAGESSTNWQMIRPDIYLQAEKSNKKSNIILDTKWKELKNNNEKDHSLKSTYNIEIDDLYQMLTYGIRYQATDIWLLYPKSPNEPPVPIKVTTNNGNFHSMTIHIFTVNLMDIEKSLDDLIQDIEKVI